MGTVKAWAKFRCIAIPASHFSILFSSYPPTESPKKAWFEKAAGDFCKHFVGMPAARDLGRQARKSLSSGNLEFTWSS